MAARRPEPDSHTELTWREAIRDTEGPAIAAGAGGVEAVVGLVRVGGWPGWLIDCLVDDGFADDLLDGGFAGVDGFEAGFAEGAHAELAAGVAEVVE